jgi:hypothetical protein
LILHPGTGTPIRSFEQIRQDAEALESFLASRGLEIDPDSALSRALSAAKVLGESAVPGTRPPKDIVIALGAAFLSRALTEAASQNSFCKLERLVPNIVSLGSDPIPTSTVNEPTQSRNFVFELEVGACFLAGGVPAEAAEPDIVLEEGGRWNIAVKSLYSDRSTTLVDNVRIGIGQALKAPGPYGMVFVGVSNTFAAGQFLPLISPDDDVWGSFPDAPSAIAAVRREVIELESIVKREAEFQFLKGREDTRFRGIVFVAHTVCGIAGTPGLLTHVSLVDRNDLFGNSIYGPEGDLAKRFWGVTQRLLST